MENNNVYYYIFGQEAVKIFDQGGLNELLEYIKENKKDFSLISFDNTKQKPQELIDLYKLYKSWTEINEEEYNVLLNGC